MDGPHKTTCVERALGHTKTLMKSVLGFGKNTDRVMQITSVVVFAIERLTLQIFWTIFDTMYYQRNILFCVTCDQMC